MDALKGNFRLAERLRCGRSGALIRTVPATHPLEAPVSRVQLAINVPDIDAAVAFYTRLLGVAPHKVRPGYANFEVADPPLKLVLVERDCANQLNHLGVEVETSAEVRAETRRLAAAGMATVVEESTVCCHAEQDKVWVRDPAGIRWEVYTITDDAPNRGRVAALATAEVPAPTGARTSPECCVR